MRIPRVALRSEIGLPEVAAEKDCRSPFGQLIKCGMGEYETCRQDPAPDTARLHTDCQQFYDGRVTSNPYRKCTRRS